MCITILLLKGKRKYNLQAITHYDNVVQCSLACSRLLERCAKESASFRPLALSFAHLSRSLEQAKCSWYLEGNV